MNDTLEAKIGRMCFVGFEGLEPPAYLLEWLRAGRVGGVILFSRNIASPAQVAALTDALQAAAAPEGVIVSIDQEGGTVARLRAAQGFTEVPSAMALTAAELYAEHGYTEAVAGVLGREMRALGIHWNYAPDVDLYYTSRNPSVLTRSFGASSYHVGKMAAAFVKGLQDQGVAACAKHFPGLGKTAIDSHVALPTNDFSLDRMRGEDLHPYKFVIEAGIASVMVTHTIITAVDKELPATLSPLVVKQLLRENRRFDGVAATDCMEMKAISDNYGTEESAVLAALAGIDAILFSHTPARQEAAHDALLDAARSGRLPVEMIDAANRRLLALREKYLKPRGDLSAIRSKEHLETARKAARASIVLLQKGSALPLRAPGNGVGVVEFPSALESGIVEAGGQTGFARMLLDRLPNAEVVYGKAETAAEAEAVAARVDTLIIAERNSELNPFQERMVDRLIRQRRSVIVVALRQAFRAGLYARQVDTIIDTLGDAEPSLEAAVAALCGDYEPTGKLSESMLRPTEESD